METRNIRRGVSSYHPLLLTRVCAECDSIFVPRRRSHVKCAACSGDKRAERS
jgi:hypothetical protein